MNASSSQNKRKEGCGKWLTKKSKSTMIQQLHFKPCLIKTMKPVIFESKTKSCKLKQSTMSQFLVEETSSKTIEHEINFKHRKRKNDYVLVSLKRGFTKHEDHRGSDENDSCQTDKTVKKESLKERDHILKDIPTVYCKDVQTEISFQRNCPNLNQKGTEKFFPPPKRFRKSKDSMGKGAATLRNYSAGNEVDFTQWFENEVEVFIQHQNEDTNAQSILSCGHTSACKTSDSKEELPEFSEWFNQHVQTINQKELPIKILQSPVRDLVQQDSTFTQWLEANIDNIKSP